MQGHGSFGVNNRRVATDSSSRRYFPQLLRVKRERSGSEPLGWREDDTATRSLRDLGLEKHSTKKVELGLDGSGSAERLLQRIQQADAEYLEWRRRQAVE
jgi:hypothetical protein